MAAAVLANSQLTAALSHTLGQTDYSGVGELQRGKVRDSYVQGDRRAIVVSDRLSAFDRIVCTVPFKGQVLNSISAYWFEQTQDICPNHLISVPDPCVSIVRECEPFAVEMVVRGYLTGSSPTSIWTHYHSGERSYCGHALPDGMRQHQQLPQPLITPTTKAEKGQHDALLEIDQIVELGLVDAKDFRKLCRLALALFARGQQLASERGLILVDTKYEFGKLPDGTIALIDEVHTPDSSRYWYADSYNKTMQDGGEIKALDKEYVRRYLSDELGFRGDGETPELPDAVRVEAARRYIEIYETVTGREFEASTEAPAARIESALRKAMAS